MPLTTRYSSIGTCSWDGCPKEIVPSRSRSGLCDYHATRTWKLKNSERVNHYNRTYNAKNPEKKAAWVKKWLDANPGYIAEAEATRRARKTSQFVERVYRSVVFRRDNGTCGICGLPVDPNDWHLDHVIPLARGGEHSYANTQVSHPTCNIKKGAKVLKDSHHGPGSPSHGDGKGA